MFALLASAAIAAAAPVQITVNDRPLAAAAVVRAGRVLVPFRSIFSELGASVDYRARDHRVIAKRGADRIVLTAGDRQATLNGFPVALNVAPQIIADRMFVPLRFAAQALGARVSYDAADRLVSVRAPMTQPTPAVSLATPAATFPTSAPVPYVVNSQTYPAYGNAGFNLFIPDAYDTRVFFPGERVRFVLFAPPNGTAFLQICGFDRIPFVAPMGSTQYFTSFVVPSRWRNRDCTAVAYYTGALGATRTVEFSRTLFFAAPTPSPTPQPTSRPTPRPTATPAPPRRELQPVFRATPPPG